LISSAICRTTSLSSSSPSLPPSLPPTPTGAGSQILLAAFSLRDTKSGMKREEGGRGGGREGGREGVEQVNNPRWHGPEPNSQSPTSSLPPSLPPSLPFPLRTCFCCISC
jgi:hypothetical protein